MSKRIEKQLNSFKYKGEAIKITPGTIIMTGLCILLIIVATFTQLTLVHPYLPANTFSLLSQNLSEHELVKHFLITYKYIPQIPMVFFIVSLLGRRFGILAIVGYIILGMFFPIFALGGGLSYFFEYGFGYILAFIPAVFFAGTLMKDKTDFIRILLISVIGVLIVHVLGVLYMLFIATLRHAPMDLIAGWILSQSGIQIFYDIFFTAIGIILGRQFRKLLWIALC